MIGTDFWTLRNAWLLARPEAIFEIRISVRPGIPLKRLCPWDAKYRAARKKWEWSTLSLVLSPYFLIAPESRAVLVMCSQGGLPLECWVRSLRCWLNYVQVKTLHQRSLVFRHMNTVKPSRLTTIKL